MCSLPPCRTPAPPRFTVFLRVKDFAESFCTIPTQPWPGTPSVTVSSLYAFGRATLYDAGTQRACGTCSASFLCQQTSDIFVDISNYIALDSGLVVSWFTPARPADLAADSLIEGMVTQALVRADTKVSYNPYFGATFSLTVSGDGEIISFLFQQIGPALP